MSGTAESALHDAAELYAGGRPAEAERAYRAIVAAEPGFVPGHRRLIGLLRSEARWAEALGAARTALRANPEDASLAYTLGISLLELGQWDEGFYYYEARRLIAPQEFVAPPAGTPEWKGEPVRSVLILPEQGFGDAIQFARYAQALQSFGTRVTLICRPELRRLFQTLGAPVETADQLPGLPRHDAFAYQGSLPRWLRGAPSANFKVATSDGGGVGVVARGNPAHGNDRRRSLHGADAERLLALGRSLQPEDTGARDFLDTAGIVAGLDLVVSVDTAVAHLAASLGKPTWILLPDAGADWRWMRDTAVSPWYPSVRLYRQARGGGWSEVLDRVERDLADTG